MMNFYLTFVNLLMLLRLLASVSAYDFLIRNDNTGTDGNYFKEIRDGLTGDWIGEMYQDSVFDSAGRRLGINQGYSFDFDNGTSYNDNNILFLNEGNEIYWMDNAIIVATGMYKQYQGGSFEFNVVQFDPTMVAELTLVAPPPLEDFDDNGARRGTGIRITSEGGYYLPITSPSGDQIGQKFQNPITRPKSNMPNLTVGVNQGYSFIFPQDDFINNILGYSLPEQVLGNRRFIVGGEDGDEALVFNEQVIHATKRLRKYVGTTLSEEILSTDPQYVADITLPLPSDKEEGAGEDYISDGPYDFRITSEGGFYDPILDANGMQIGERFQNPVYNSSNARIGTNQGYGFNFPVSTFAPPIAHGNRLFYLEGGTLDVLNEAIVAASGIYRKYDGGRFKETIVSYNPVFVSEIVLLESDSSTETEDNGENKDEDSTSNGATSRFQRPLTLIFFTALVGTVFSFMTW